MSSHSPATASFSSQKMLSCMKLSVMRLTPLFQMRNPVMFVVYIGAVLTTLHLFTSADLATLLFTSAIALTLWFTVLFANFAQAYAEERGRAQASTLRRARQDIQAKRLTDPEHPQDFTLIAASELKAEDFVYVAANDFIPADGQVIKGIATIDESAITGESAPVIRESGGDRDAVTGGTRVLSGLDHPARYNQSRRKHVGPHDRDGRRRKASKDS